MRQTSIAFGMLQNQWKMFIVFFSGKWQKQRHINALIHFDFVSRYLMNNQDTISDSTLNQGSLTQLYVKIHLVGDVAESSDTATGRAWECKCWNTLLSTVERILLSNKREFYCQITSFKVERVPWKPTSSVESIMNRRGMNYLQWLKVSAFFLSNLGYKLTTQRTWVRGLLPTGTFS